MALTSSSVKEQVRALHVAWVAPLGLWGLKPLRWPLANGIYCLTSTVACSLAVTRGLLEMNRAAVPLQLPPSAHGCLAACMTFSRLLTPLLPCRSRALPVPNATTAATTGGDIERRCIVDPTCTKGRGTFVPDGRAGSCRCKGTYGEPPAPPLPPPPLWSCRLARTHAPAPSYCTVWLAPNPPPS